MHLRWGPREYLTPNDSDEFIDDEFLTRTNYRLLALVCRMCICRCLAEYWYQDITKS